MFLLASTHTTFTTCSGHSNEAALLIVFYDLFFSDNKHNMYILPLLDFSSAFDAIDHSMHVPPLHTDFDLPVLSINSLRLT